MSGKFALVIGNTEYTDPSLAQLTVPSKDVEDFARVLKDKDICAFDDVNVLLNQHTSIVMEAIDNFFDQNVWLHKQQVRYKHKYGWLPEGKTYHE